jgi:hypothetical protein
VIRLARPSRAWLAAAGLGAAMLGTAAALDPAGWLIALAGAIALAAALALRWPAAGTGAAAAAVVLAAIGIVARALPGIAVVAGGTMILAYLLALDLAESGAAGGVLRQVRGRALVLAAGLAAAALTALAAAVPAAASLWLIVTGTVAAGSVLLVATGRR